MKKALATISMVAAITLGGGCQTQQNMSARPRDGFEKTPFILAQSNRTPAAPMKLGAGDTLGREVFVQAVALARAGRETNWMASTGGRAILPAFTAHQSVRDTTAADQRDAELWALLTEAP